MARVRYMEGLKLWNGGFENWFEKRFFASIDKVKAPIERFLSHISYFYCFPSMLEKVIFSCMFLNPNNFFQFWF